MVDATREHYHSSHYTGAWPPPDVVRASSPPRAPPPEPQVHVLLCHVCCVCGRMRSAGFHRHHPVIPGQPQVQTPCRRCKKKAKKEREKRERPDSGTRTIRIEIDGGESRGRARSREKVVYVARRRSSPSPRRTRARSTSRAHVGVRVLRQSRSPPEALRRKTRTERVSSSSPPVDLRFRRHRSDEVYSTRERPHAHLSSRRVTELSPSPPSTRTRTSTRVEYRHESPESRSPEHRRVNPSPVRVGRRDCRSDDARSRLAAHPSAYRMVEVDRRTLLRESEGSVSTDSRQPSPPPRGILRHPDLDYRTSRRRRMEASHDSLLPEPGGSRVQFAGEPRRVERREVDYTREHVRRHQTQRGYVEDVPPSPPSPPRLERSFERLRVRPASPPSSRGYEDEVRVRHVSPRRYEEVRVRRSSPPPRGRTESRREPSPSAASYDRYHSIERPCSVSPPTDPRHEDWEDVTESDSDHENKGDLVSVRRYRAVDDSGRPATFVEERRTRYVNPGAPPPVERTFPTTPAITRGFQPV